MYNIISPWSKMKVKKRFRNKYPFNCCIYSFCCMEHCH